MADRSAKLLKRGRKRGRSVREFISNAVFQYSQKMGKIPVPCEKRAGALRREATPPPTGVRIPPNHSVPRTWRDSGDNHRC